MAVDGMALDAIKWHWMASDGSRRSLRLGYFFSSHLRFSFLMLVKTKVFWHQTLPLQRHEAELSFFPLVISLLSCQRKGDPEVFVFTWNFIPLFHYIIEMILTQAPRNHLISYREISWLNSRVFPTIPIFLQFAVVPLPSFLSFSSLCYSHFTPYTHR